MKLQKIVLTTFRRLGGSGVDLRLIDWDYIRTNQSINYSHICDDVTFENRNYQRISFETGTSGETTTEPT